MIKVFFTSNTREPTLWGYAFRNHAYTSKILKNTKEFTAWCQSQGLTPYKDQWIAEYGGTVVGTVDYNYVG